MTKEIKKGMPEFEMFQDLFGFLKEYGTPERNEEYWDDMVKAATALNRKWRETPQSGIVANCMVALMNYLDAQAHDMRQQKGG